MFKLKAAISPYIVRENYGLDHTSVGRTLGPLFFVTFGDPHVYIDAVLLIATISIQFFVVEEAYFGVLLRRFLVGAWMWRLVDISFAIIMLSLSLSMLRNVGWIKVRNFEVHWIKILSQRP